MPQDYNVRAVDRALAILDCFSSTRNAMTLAEIAQSVDLSASTVLRLLATLENKNYVYKNKNNSKYYLGMRLAQLGDIVVSNMDICVEAQPLMHELCATFNESVGIYKKVGDQRMCITRTNGNQTLRSVLTVGSTYPLTRGAAGRVLLAFSSPEEIDSLLKQDSFTTKKALNKILADGYTISQGERDAAVESIAAPIFNSSGEVKYALFLTGPIGRFTTPLKKKMVEAICAAAKQLSARMGYIEK